MLKPLLRRDDRGIGAVEFALVAPVLISFIIGVSQVGRMFYANADMKNATAHAARLASIYRPDGEEVDDATLIAAVRERLLRDGATSKVTVTVTRGTDNGNPYVQLRTDYSVPLEFIFFSTPPVTLHETRKVYTQVASANETTYTTTSASSSTSSGSTSASTSATSAGGTSSSTSTSSTGGDTSTGSTTSSGSNASSGSNNGSSGDNNGHAHGNCNNNC